MTETDRPRPPTPALPRLLLALALAALAAAAHADQRFCGGPAKPTNPNDLENVAGDLTLEHSAQQPASMLTCAQGYMLEKCGDHATAHAVFDKCIAAGYVGAMIWKALLLQDGTGVARDLPRAAELMRRAATSDDPAYAPLGKLHYATALHLGQGVERDEAAARRWFEAAAADGSEEAREFLRTGHHTGDRDLAGAGVGPLPAPATALATGLGAPAPSPREAPPAATPPEAPPGAPADTVVRGQALERVTPDTTPASPARWLGGLIAALFAAGMVRQAQHRFPLTRRPT